MLAVETALWVLFGFGLSLALWLTVKPRRPPLPRRPVVEAVRHTVKVARVRVDSRPLPRLIEPGDDLEITVIGPVHQLQDLAELTEFDELRPSRVDLIYEDEAEPEEPTAPLARILTSARGHSDCGRQRTRNEDRLLVLPERSVFVVADGMGGHNGGEVASELAVRALDEAYARRDFRGVVDSTRPIPRRARELSLAIQQANHAIYTTAATTPQLAEMGTTLVVAKFSPRKQRVYIGHVGDSRCYRLRCGSIRQLTTDHNLASVGLDGPNAGQLVRALGIEPSVTIDLIIDRPLANDVYCLCSDGLSKMLNDEEIRGIVERDRDLDAAVKSLIALANARGGKDNVTVVLVRVLESAKELLLSASNAP